MPDLRSPLMSLATSQELRGVLGPAAFNAVVVDERLTHVRRGTFPAGLLTLDELMPLGDVEIAERGQGGCTALLRIEPRMVVLLSVFRGHAEIAVAGGDRGAVDRVTVDLVAALRDDERSPDEVSVTFWAHAGGGPPLNPRRCIEAPAWDEIRDNYASAARVALDGLMRATSPGPGGLVLWHGEPGTGKSYALRALAREWQGWCDTHFITDPDAFLGSHTNYLLSTLLRTDRGASGEPRWRLVVLEDAGELLAADARAVTGQALSRLLNVTDGLLGSGLRAIVLVTTNEPVGRLHEAVVRPGRCWAQIEFTGMPADEADAWLAEQGVESPPGREATIAELYATADGRRVAERTTLGFGV